MNKLLMLFAVVAVVAAKPIDSDMKLLKRLLDLLQENKRESNYISFNTSTKVLKVNYIARTGATGVVRHHAYVTNSAGVEVGNFQTSQYSSNGGGVIETYTMSGLTSGATYTVKACEVNNDDSEDYCNTRTFTA